MIDIYDPWANVEEVKAEYGIEIDKALEGERYSSAAIVAVAHREFLSIDFNTLMTETSVIYDTKAFLDPNIVDGRL